MLIRTGKECNVKVGIWGQGHSDFPDFAQFLVRLVYFDLNDFDEGVLAPLAFDLTWMVVSIFVAFASLGIDEKKARHMGRLFLTCYANTPKNGKADYIEPKIAKGLICDFLTAVSKCKQKDILNKKLNCTKTNWIVMAL